MVLYRHGAPGGSLGVQDPTASITSGRVALVASALSLALGVGGGLDWSVIESGVPP
ncbi:MAG TPA: hypothetical protein VFM07_07670 [Intrasporangium sp.]|nr:hypothetical protein [Intrasporangium sp.]